MKGVAAFLGVCVLLLSSAASYAQTESSLPEATKEEVSAFVDKAVDYAKAHGKAAALKVFSDQSGEFVRGELYIYAYDFGGTVIAHGGQPNLIGKNLIDMKDANGVYVIQELIKLAEKGGGWLAYLWPDPVRGNKIEHKIGYVRKVDDTWFLGSGCYQK